MSVRLVLVLLLMLGFAVACNTGVPVATSDACEMFAGPAKKTLTPMEKSVALSDAKLEDQQKYIVALDEVIAGTPDELLDTVAEIGDFNLKSLAGSKPDTNQRNRVVFAYGNLTLWKKLNC